MREGIGRIERQCLAQRPFGFGVAIFGPGAPRAAPRRPNLVFGPDAAARRKQPTASSRWPNMWTKAPARNQASVSDGRSSVARW